MKQRLIIFATLLFLLVSGCASESVSTSPATFETLISETEAAAPVAASTAVLTYPPAPVEDQSVETAAVEIPAAATEPPQLTSTPEHAPTLAPGAWKSLPVIPETISDQVRAVYQHGLELGNNPQAFSKIGDCGSTPAWFLGDFDRGSRYYRLGDNSSLEPVIQYFQGSFGRTSLAAKEGFNASSVFARIWANREQCAADETPLACEYRVHRPAFAFIMLGTNDVWHMDTFEPQMRKIIEFSMENGVVPILSTKADNREGDESINDTIASLSVEYGLPLWNYWSAVQPLPDHGLQEDGSHITWGPNRFDDPQVMRKGWPVRNLTALQMLDLIWRNLANGDAQ